MPGPVWNHDDPRDIRLIDGNAVALVNAFQADAYLRQIPAVADVLSWHTALYENCAVPFDNYVGHFRGDPNVPDLLGYEVGVGPTQADGYPAKMGLPSPDVTAAVGTLFGQLAAALHQLDAELPWGNRPTTVDEIQTVIILAAVVHGEWVRIHPYANGNGRTARLWAAWIALRYGLPIFVSVKPRPGDIAYANSSAASMGRPPDFQGDHSAAVNVFSSLLALSLLP